MQALPVPQPDSGPAVEPPSKPEHGNAQSATAALPILDTAFGAAAVPGSPDLTQVRAHVRRNLLRGALGVVALFIGFGAVGFFFDEQLRQLTQVVYETLGLPALAALLFVTDAFISPVPPQAVLFVIAKSPLHENWVPIVLGLALLSSLAGTTGWWMASRLGETRFGRHIVGRFRDENRIAIQRWGALGIVFCAVTPVPYSVTCWSAGVLRVPARTFVWLPLLRIPRIILYYCIIASASGVFRAIL